MLEIYTKFLSNMVATTSLVLEVKRLLHLLEVIAN